MSILRWVLSIVMTFGLVSCGAAKPVVMPNLVGLRLDVALSDVKRAGFKDEVEVLGGGTFGVVNKENWTVCEQDPAAGREVTSVPRLRVDRACEGGAASTGTQAPTSATSTSSAEPSPSSEILTAANSRDLAALLASHRLKDLDKHRAFVERHRDSVIEFDGTIALSMPHGSYKTRFDFLIYQGNHSDPQPTPGPSFAFIDKNYYDLKLTGKNIPDSFKEGMNVTVVATIVDFDEKGGYIELDPVSTMVRG